MIREHTATTLAQIIEAGLKITSEFGHPLWWRGHGTARWSLVASVFRHQRERSWEVYLTNEFRNGAGSRHPSCPAFEDIASWLALMQHYRLPTRLLDWTESLMTAAFFATEGVEPPGEDRYAVVWSLSAPIMNQVLHGDVVYGINHKAVVPFLAPSFSAQEPEQKGAMAVSPAQSDIRLLTQQAGFTVHGDEQPLDEIEGSEQFLCRILLPEEDCPRIADELAAVGIRRSTLFPDLENLARELSRGVLR
ncbi:MAG TPA: FRG domain-containing protein [Fimbriimonadaceae bacterium]|nr:FRG domain-containing protein [Fimbriimonadaceae bacterium]